MKTWIRIVIPTFFLIPLWQTPALSSEQSSNPTPNTGCADNALVEVRFVPLASEAPLISATLNRPRELDFNRRREIPVQDFRQANQYAAWVQPCGTDGVIDYWVESAESHQQYQLEISVNHQLVKFHTENTGDSRGRIGYFNAGSKSYRVDTSTLESH